MNRRTLLMSASATAGALFPGLRALAFERVGDRRTLVFSGGQPVPVLDPHVRYDWSTRMMQQAVYDALAKYQGNPARVTPWLAESWEVSADGRTWTFHLAGNARFHNGDPVDAEAVRFSYRRALRLNKGVAWMLKGYLDPDAIEALDPRTVRMTLTKPYGAFLSFVPLWFIVNPRQAGGEDDGQRFLVDGDAGSGPFRIKRWDPQAVMALDAVADYWKGWPMPDADRPAGVIYRVMREAAPRKAALQRGEVDMVTEMTPDDYDVMAKLPGIDVPSFPGMTPFTIQMNTQHGPCADLNLRRALAYAFDYQALIQIENGAARLLDSPFPDAIQGHIAVPGIPRRDMDRAREHLGKTQWAKGGLSLDYTYVAGLEVERRIGLALLDSVQPLGITVNVVAQPWPTLVARGGEAGNGVGHGGGVCHARQPGCGRHLGAVLVRGGGAVLGNAPVGGPAARRHHHVRAVRNGRGEADGAVCGDPEAHRRAAAGDLRHDGGPQVGRAVLRARVRLLPGPADGRGGPVHALCREGVAGCCCSSCAGFCFWASCWPGWW